MVDMNVQFLGGQLAGQTRSPINKDELAELGYRPALTTKPRGGELTGCIAVPIDWTPTEAHQAIQDTFGQGSQPPLNLAIADDGSTTNGINQVSRLYPFLQGSKWGYIDQSGTIVIQPQFDDAKPFHDGLAVVIDGRTGCHIDKSGGCIYQQKYRFADDFSEGMAIVSVNGKDGYIDTSGNLVVDTIYREAGRFQEGLAKVRTNIRKKYDTVSG